jgi:hypothetical protein
MLIEQRISGEIPAPLKLPWLHSVAWKLQSMPNQHFQDE